MSSPPTPLITSDDKSMVVQLVSTILLVFSVLATITRSGTKLAKARRFDAEDWLATCATSGYAANILFILGQTLAKLSYALSVMKLAQQVYRRVIQIFGLVILLWGVSAFFVLLFPCHLPAPWDYIHGTCIDLVGFWVYVCVSNILTEAMVLAIMIVVVWQIRTSASRKLVVMSVFGMRVIVVPIIICQAVYYPSALTFNDTTFALWKPTLIVGVLQTISIVTICVPFLKPFLDSLETGQLGVEDIAKSRSTTVQGSYDNGRMGTGQSRSKGRRGIMLTDSSSHSKLHELRDMSNASRVRNGAVVTADRKIAAAWDGQSHTSQTGLIHETKTWDVRVEKELDRI